MKLLLDSFWRAAAYCLHPRVIVLSLLPLVLMSVLALVAGYFFWAGAVEAVRVQIASWSVLGSVFGWMASIGLPDLQSALAPLVVVAVLTPLIVVLSLLLVAGLMTPSMLALVAQRRFPLLERKQGGSFIGAIFGAAWATLVALVALLVTVPLWFIPPLVLVLPPLIWGWLTYRVMTYDVLADHASAAEREALMRSYRPSLLAMGVISGYLGAAPSLVWASGILFIALAPVLVPVAVWIYTLVFAFSSLWFAHYALAALEQMRAVSAVDPLASPWASGTSVAPVTPGASVMPVSPTTRARASDVELLPPP